MGKEKDWNDRLKETYLSLDGFVGDEAGKAARDFAKKQTDHVLKDISGCMSQGWSLAKKQSNTWKERQKRRCVILLHAVLLDVKRTKITKAALKLINTSMKKLKGNSLDKALTAKWDSVKEAVTQREVILRQGRLEKERKRKKAERALRTKTNPLELSLAADVLDFMKKWSVQPIPEVKGKNDFTKIAMKPNDVKREMMLVPSAKFQGALELRDKAGEPPHKLGKVYYLPWASKHITSLVIPQGRSSDGSPGVFYTSALSGCSVFVTGDPKSPTVYHAGVDGSVGESETPTPKGSLTPYWKEYNAVEFWRQLFLKIMNDARKKAGKGNLTLNDLMGQVAEITKTDYVDDISKPSGGFDDSLRRTTAHSRAFLAKQPKGQGKPDFHIASPWGCVFGKRDAHTNKWAFYIQENVALIYLKTGANPVSYRACIPVGIRQFYPRRDDGAKYPYAHRCWDSVLGIAKPFEKDGLRVL
jgi:hypothetical protein